MSYIINIRYTIYVVDRDRIRSLPRGVELDDDEVVLVDGIGEVRVIQRQDELLRRFFASNRRSEER